MTGTKVATAILEIRTDTGTFKADVSKMGEVGNELGNVFTNVGKIFEKLSANAKSFAKGFDSAGDSASKFAKTTKQGMDDAARSYEQAGVSFGKLVSSYISAQAIIGAARGAWNLVTGAIADSIKAAGEAEKAHVQVVAALRAQGTAVPSVVKAYGDYASALQKTTIYQDDALEGAEALLVTVGSVMPRDMEKALKATTELASGLGKELPDAAMLVSKAAEGNITALKKAGVVIDETKAKSEGFGYVLDQITAKFGGQAAAIANTYEGRLAQLGNTWNNVQESIGRAITTNATVIDLLGRVNKLIEDNTGELKDNAKVAQFVSDVVIGTVRAFTLLLETLDKLNLVRAGLVITMRMLGEGLGYVAIAGARAAQGIALAAGDWQGAAQAGRAAQALSAAVKELSDRNAATVQGTISFGNAISTVTAKADALAKQLEQTRGKTIETKDATDSSTDAWGRHTVSQIKDTEAAKKLAEAIDKIHSAQREGFGTPVTAVFGDDASYKRVTGNMSAFLEGIDKIGDHTDDTIEKLKAKFAEFGDIFRNSKIVVEGVTIPVRLGFSADEAASLFGSLGGEQFAQFFSKLPNVKPQVNASGFDFGKSFSAGFRTALRDLPTSILRAIQGGGNIAGAIAGTLGSSIGSALDASLQVSITGAMKNGMGKMTGALLSGLSSMIPVVGSLMGPLIDKLFSIGGPSKAEQEGRKVVEEFEKQFSSVDDMINQVGAAYIMNGRSADEASAAIRRMWAAEKQGAEATKKALEEINELLKRRQEISDAIHDQGFKSQDEIMHEADIANAAYEEMLRSGKYTQAQIEEAYRHYQELLAQLEGAAGEAARAWLKAHQSADDAAKASTEAMKSAEDDLKALIDKRDSLAKGIAAEAPEEVMGVIETQQRGELAALDKQIQEKADAYAQLAKDTGQQMADAIKEALERLHVTIDVGYNLPNVPGNTSNPPGSSDNTGVAGGVDRGAPTPEAAGDYLHLSRPRRFLAGERGPEDVVFGGAGRNLAGDVAEALRSSGALGGVSVGGVYVTMPEGSYADPRQFAEMFKQVLRTDADVYEATRTVARRAVGLS